MKQPRTRGLGPAAAVLVVGLAGGFPGGASSTDAGETIRLRSKHLSFDVPAADRRLGEAILGRAEKALGQVLDQMPGPLEDRVVLVWCPTETAFYDQIGGELGRVLAVAAPSKLRVYLNGPQMRRIDLAQVHQTLMHEFAHIYLGRQVRWPIPLWLNEGLAMVVSEDWGLDDAAALATDGLFRALYSPNDLAEEFPKEAGAKRRAYRQSRSMTAFLIDLRYAKSGARGLVADLAQPSGRSVLRPLLSDPEWLDRFHVRWRQERVRPGQLVLFLTSSGTLWIALTFLLIVAYRRKRRQRRQRESRWAWEEEFGYYDDGFDD